MAASLISLNFPRPQLIISSSWGGSIRFNSRKVKAAAAAAVSPWLMLPPSLDGTAIVYDFYSLGDDKVRSFNKRRTTESEELPDDEAEFVGMSHGWLACYNLNQADQGDGSLFLSNPLSHRHVKLPSALDLPQNSEPGERMHVDNVVISSPDPLHDQNCRALLIYGPARRLAFCCPARRSSEWTPLGNDDGGYCSLVYSTRQTLFLCLTEYHGIEAWDLNSPDCPTMTPIKDVQYDKSYPVACSSQQEREAKFFFIPSASLALAHKSDDLYQVRRFTVLRMGPDGSHVCMNFGQLGDFGHVEAFPYKTTDFDVYKYDNISKDWKYMDCYLDGMAIFVGKNHGFALSAADYPGLKPDTVYFTDTKKNPYYQDVGGGHDMGIFSYRNKTFSPCYYPCDYASITKVLPPPLWFTPNCPT